MDSISPSATESLGLVVEITPSKRFVEAVAEKMKATDSATGSSVDELAQKMVDVMGTANIASRVAESISAGDVAEYMDSGSVAEEMSQHLDYYEITSNLDISEVAEYIDASRVAEYIDVSSVAENVEVDEDAVIEGLNYKKLATALIEVLTRQQRLEAEAAYKRELGEATMHRHRPVSHAEVAFPTFREGHGLPMFSRLRWPDAKVPCLSRFPLTPYKEFEI